jgi:hypothetical protein
MYTKRIEYSPSFFTVLNSILSPKKEIKETPAIIRKKIAVKKLLYIELRKKFNIPKYRDIIELPSGLAWELISEVDGSYGRVLVSGKALYCSYTHRSGSWYVMTPKNIIDDVAVEELLTKEEKDLYRTLCGEYKDYWNSKKK